MIIVGFFSSPVDELMAVNADRESGRSAGPRRGVGHKCDLTGPQHKFCPLHRRTRPVLNIMAPFSKPETVLKQAEGLVSVGQNHAALQSLTDIFNSKRLRSTPLAALEPIMLRFVELCVDMRKGRTAKEGLMQYKNIAQNTSVGSIEIVIKRFVQLADEKVQEAQQKAEQVLVSFEDVDDLEAIETPESILLGAVSVDQNKDRTDRALVTPWLKFLWESYRTALETLKNNDRLELIYQVRHFSQLWLTIQAHIICVCSK